MRRGLILVLSALLAATAAGTIARADGPPPPNEAEVCGTAWTSYSRPDTHTGERLLRDQLFTASDGTLIAADVHLPDGPLADTVDTGAYPTIVTITGYNKNGALGSANAYLVRHGYAHVVVDDRGTGSSGGQWDAWGERTQRDYGEVIDWIASQPYSTGDVGMIGASYMGLTQLFTAAQHPAALKALFAHVPSGDAYRDITFEGGQINAAFIPLWMGLVAGLGSLPPSYTAQDPAAAAETLREHLINHVAWKATTTLQGGMGGEVAYDGPFWRTRSPIEIADEIDVPVFLFGGLDDLFQRSTPMLYEILSGNVETKLIEGPWSHLGGSTGSGLPRDGIPSPDELALRWFDAYLQGMGTQPECMPDVTQWLRGPDAAAEHYVVQPDWPHPDLSARQLHLHADGTLDDIAPGATEAGRTMVQHPVSGPCSRSSNQWLIGALDGSCSRDNRLAEVDQLSYTTAPMTEDTIINGPIEADVWMSTTASDATLSVAVSVVSPDGTSKGLTNGLMTASMRAVDPGRSRMLDGLSIQPWHPFTKDSAMPVVPGEAIRVPIEVFQTHSIIPAGYRLRITIAPSDFPHALASTVTAGRQLGGVVTVLHDAAHPSTVTLPVQAS